MRKYLYAAALLAYVLLPFAPGYAADPNRTDPSALGDSHARDTSDTSGSTDQDSPDMNGGWSHDQVPPPPPPGPVPVYHDLSAPGPSTSAAGAPAGAPPAGSVNAIPNTGGAQQGNWKSGMHPPALGPKMGGAAQVELKLPPAGR